MISPPTLRAAIDTLAADGKARQIVLFGSYARGDASDQSDVDLLVIEDEVTDRAGEMVRLRRLLRPLRIPVDVLVYSSDEIARLAHQTGTALYWAMKEGKIVHG
jgi:predicted nucleotidyltransferase